ncbi:MAG: hypothetical protein GY927_09225, partial [bacterium]|nr:hypothetical protein [bacterium]
MNVNLTSDDLFRVGEAIADLEKSDVLAATITKTASKQSYYTVRFLVDRERVADAYRAYAYFRWVDDILDESMQGKAERLAFIKQQKALIDYCYRGERPLTLTPQEQMLPDLILHDNEANNGLRAY